MGVWPYLVAKMRREPIEVIARKESSSTATGYNKQHLRQQEYIVNTAFEITKTLVAPKATVASKTLSVTKAATKKATVAPKVTAKKVDTKKVTVKKVAAKKLEVKKSTKAKVKVAPKAAIKKVVKKTTKKK